MTTRQDQPLPFARSEAPGFQLTRSTGSHWSVRLWGSLGPLWTGAFSLGLSHAGLSILQGFARQDENGRWLADFVITPTDKSGDPAAIDYLALARGAPAEEPPGPVELTHYALDGAPDQGAALYLELNGPDRLGFLGSLLRLLEDQALSPREVVISTREGMVFGRFFLKTISGQVPSDSSRRALAAVLDACRGTRPQTAFSAGPRSA